MDVKLQCTTCDLHSAHPRAAVSTARFPGAPAGTWLGGRASLIGERSRWVAYCDETRDPANVAKQPVPYWHRISVPSSFGKRCALRPSISARMIV